MGKNTDNVSGEGKVPADKLNPKESSEATANAENAMAVVDSENTTQKNATETANKAAEADAAEKAGTLDTLAVVAEKPETIMLKFIKSPAEFNLCWNIGDVKPISVPLANELIEAKIAVLVNE